MVLTVVGRAGTDISWNWFGEPSSTVLFGKEGRKVRQKKLQLRALQDSSGWYNKVYKDYLPTKLLFHFFAEFLIILFIYLFIYLFIRYLFVGAWVCGNTAQLANKTFEADLCPRNIITNN